MGRFLRVTTLDIFTTKAPWWFWICCIPIALFGVWPELRIRVTEKIVGPTPVVTSEAPVPQLAPEKKMTARKTTAPHGYRAPPPALPKLDNWLGYGTQYGGRNSALRELRTHDIAVTESAYNILSERLSGSIREDAGVEIVYKTPKELGIKYAATLHTIVAAARASGLSNVPVDAIPAIALAHSGTRRLHIAAQVAPSAYPWRAIIMVGKSTEGAGTGIASLDWSDAWTRNFEREKTFDPNLTFVFAR